MVNKKNQGVCTGIDGKPAYRVNTKDTSKLVCVFCNTTDERQSTLVPTKPFWICSTFTKYGKDTLYFCCTGHYVTYRERYVLKLAETVSQCVNCDSMLADTTKERLQNCWFNGTDTVFFCSDGCEENYKKLAGVYRQLDTKWYCFGCGHKLALPVTSAAYPTIQTNLAKHEPHELLGTAYFCTESCKNEWNHRQDEAAPVDNDAPGLEIEILTALNNPVDGSHYKRRFKGHVFQVFDLIDMYQLDYYSATAIAYIIRAGIKNDKRLEDIRKAIRTLQWLENKLAVGGNNE
jgi:hypothetical protein